MITKYGYNTLGIITIAVFLLIILSFFVQNSYVKILLIVLPVIILLFTINFFRDPDRVIPKEDNVVVSPADGKVIIIKDFQDKNFINGPAKQISIFMSPLNVHVNRIPINGKVTYLKYHEGDYIMAFEDKASERNERSEFGIESQYGKVFFTQVAGFVARRIVYEIKLGDSVQIGKRFGMIKFGSRVDVIVSDQWKTKVQMNQNVKAGETILFEHPTR
ncbi:MAG: phosphatidylserine decarboxylase family protein [Ignavibacteriaceae bacterium]|nr:phosphatidylserine decarboxylase family protein [Ignavibacteriaceae bacterium]